MIAPVSVARSITPAGLNRSCAYQQHVTQQPNAPRVGVDTSTVSPPSLFLMTSPGRVPVLDGHVLYNPEQDRRHLPSLGNARLRITPDRTARARPCPWSCLPMPAPGFQADRRRCQTRRPCDPAPAGPVFLAAVPFHHHNNRNGPCRALARAEQRCAAKLSSLASSSTYDLEAKGFHLGQTVGKFSVWSGYLRVRLVRSRVHKVRLRLPISGAAAASTSSAWSS